MPTHVQVVLPVQQYLGLAKSVFCAVKSAFDVPNERYHSTKKNMFLLHVNGFNKVLQSSPDLGTSSAAVLFFHFTSG